MDYNALNSELITDPLARGYSGMSDAAAAADLNTVYRTRTRDTVSGSEILNATDDAEFTALADPTDKNRWLSLCGIAEIDTGNGVAKSLEADLFGAGTTTRDNLAALKSESISRAVELGLGTVRAGDVEYARSI